MTNSPAGSILRLRLSAATGTLAAFKGERVLQTNSRTLAHLVTFSEPMNRSLFEAFETGEMLVFGLRWSEDDSMAPGQMRLLLRQDL